MENLSVSRWAPSSKVTAAGLAGAVVTWVVWALDQFWGYTLPAEVAAASVTVVSFLLAYVVGENRPAPSDQARPAVEFTPEPHLLRPGQS